HRRAVHRCRGKPVRALFRRESRPDRHFPDLHPGAVVPPNRSVRSQGMIRAYAPILIAGGLMALVPLGVSSNTVLNFLVFTLIIAIAAQGWNVLGGYGGQISFGHSAFFGTGAYTTALLQVHAGVNAWAAFVAGVVL